MSEHSERVEIAPTDLLANTPVPVVIVIQQPVGLIKCTWPDGKVETPACSMYPGCVLEIPGKHIIANAEHHARTERT